MDSSPILDCFNSKTCEHPPIWLMRQAGRYLPEYRELRAKKGGFLDLVYDSEAACEVTLQPIRRFGFDAAILFSDILIVPFAMGQSLEFLTGEGPKLSPRLFDTQLAALHAVPERLDAIYETVRRVSQNLQPGTAFLGFAGSPWTVATYMVHGEGSRDQFATREFAYCNPSEFGALVDAIIEITVEYLSGQISAGVDAVQLFDSWAGSLSPAQFEQWVIAPNARIVSRLKQRHPGVPIIGFPKGAGEKLLAYANETGVDALGLDETIDTEWAVENLPPEIPLQGNLDPLVLLAGGKEMEAATANILARLQGRPHIFNLGHGISQHTPIEHVEKLLTLVRGS